MQSPAGITLFSPSLPEQRSSVRVHDDTEQALVELQRSVERLQELLEEVLDQANQDKMGQAQEVANSLEAEIKELKRRDKEMKDLARCEDHIHYLQVDRTLRPIPLLQLIIWQSFQIKGACQFIYLT